MTQQIFMCSNQNQFWVFISFCRAAQLGTSKVVWLYLHSTVSSIYHLFGSFGLNTVVVRVLKKILCSMFFGFSFLPRFIHLYISTICHAKHIKTALDSLPCQMQHRQWLVISFQFNNVLQLCLIHVIFRKALYLTFCFCRAILLNRVYWKSINL